MGVDRDTDTVNSSIRLPRVLHERLRQEAARQGGTVHNLMLHYIRRGLDEDLLRDMDPYERAKLTARQEERESEEQ